MPNLLSCFDEWTQPLNRWTSDVYHLRFEPVDVPLITTDATNTANRF
jgi:hypothetical protein